jgi:hypothetical protein
MSSDVPSDDPFYDTVICYNFSRFHYSNAITYDYFEVSFIKRFKLYFQIYTFVFQRSVEEEERSLALGMQFVIFRLFGYIPSPIIFGNVIDSTCLVWKAHCGQEGGFCLLYNIEQFRLRFKI